MSLPKLAVTLGDVAGIGPEIVLRLLAEGDVPARLLVIGDRGALERAADLVPGAPLPPEVGEADLDDPDWGGRRVLLLQPLAPLAPLPALGRVDAEAGAASHAWLGAAIRLALAGRVDGVVTAPIHKEAWRRGGLSYPGHTEALAHQTASERVLMLLVADRLRVALATIHVALCDVPALLDTADLAASLLVLHREIACYFGPERPRIAVCGLNPHAGEGGLFGHEEIDVIEPAVASVRERGVDAHGPLPADACIPAAAAGRWDAVFAMFHDQALPAAKALAPRRAVNATLGLPFPRTSVDHGTAFDIAGTGRATASSLRAAIALAVEMLRRHAMTLNDGV